MKPFAIASLIAVVLLALAASLHLTAAAQDQASQPMLLDVDPDPLAVKRGERQIAQFEIEVAADESERSRGLMFRTDLPPNRAMLFVFDDAHEAFFWMRNTPKPLDILFVAADGEIKTIAEDTVPFTDTPIPSRAPVRYVLEVNAGIANYLGIRPGDRLDHPIISGARR